MNRKHQTFDLTVSHDGHDLRVSGTISPEEPAHWSEWDGGSPGCPACFEDMRIFVVRGKKEREITEPEKTTKEQVKWWADLYCSLEDSVFEQLSEVGE